MFNNHPINFNLVFLNIHSLTITYGQQIIMCNLIKKVHLDKLFLDFVKNLETFYYINTECTFLMQLTIFGF